MSDTMGPGIPLDLELRPDVTVADLLDELTKHANLLIFGREERGAPDERGGLTAFRAVVIVGAAVGLDMAGEIRPAAFGLLNADGSAHGMACRPKLVKKLRQIANDIEAQLDLEAEAREAKGPLS